MSLSISQEGRSHVLWDMQRAGNGRPGVPDEARRGVEQALDQGMVLVASLWGGWEMDWLDGGCSPTYPLCSLSDASFTISDMAIEPGDGVLPRRDRQAPTPLRPSAPPPPQPSLLTRLAPSPPAPPAAPFASHQRLNIVAAAASSTYGALFTADKAIDGHMNTYYANSVQNDESSQVMQWLSLQISGGQAAVGKVAVFNRPESRFQTLLAPFEVWRGFTGFGDITTDHGAVKCGDVTSVSYGVGPFVVDCTRTRTEQEQPNTDWYVTLLLIGPARVVGIAEVFIYASVTPDSPTLPPSTPLPSTPMPPFLPAPSPPPHSPVQPPPRVATSPESPPPTWPSSGVARSTPLQRPWERHAAATPYLSGFGKGALAACLIFVCYIMARYSASWKAFLRQYVPVRRRPVGSVAIRTGVAALPREADLEGDLGVGPLASVVEAAKMPTSVCTTKNSRTSALARADALYASLD